MANTATNNLNAFFRGEPSFLMPFNLVIDNCRYHCTDVLRLLPKKRLVLKAQDEHGNQRVIKLFAKQKKGKRAFNQEQQGYQLVKKTDVNMPLLIVASTVMPDFCVIVYQYLNHSLPFADDKNTLGFYADALLKLTATLHKAGLYQADFHLGNILIVDKKLYLIDLGSIKQQGMGLDKMTILANLALLIVQFKPNEQQQLIERLPHYYKLMAWHFNADEYKHINVYVEKAWQRRKTNYLSKRFRDCSMTVYRKTWALEYGFCRAFFNQVGGESFIADIDRIMEMGKVLKSGNSATVVAVEHAAKKLVIKRYNVKGACHFLSRSLRQSRAALSWRNSNLLQLLGIATPSAFGFIERRVGRLRAQAYFICEYNDGKPMATVFADRLPTNAEQQQLKSLFTTLRKYQISHGDLKASNLLVRDNGEITLIDLDAMQEHKAKRRFIRAFNKDKNRFCRNWQQGSPLAKLCRDIIA